MRLRYALDALRNTSTADRPPVRPWWVDVRIDRRDLPRAMGALKLERVEANPPAAGPEAQITIQVEATGEAIAERFARRQLDGLGVGVLAARAYQRSARR